MTTYTVNASILLTDLPITQRPAAVAEAGFAAVEFWWPFPVAVPSDAEVDDFVSAVRDAGVQLSGLNFFAGDMAGGDRGLVSWVGRESEFADNVDVVVGIGERLGCRAFNALYGLRADGVSEAEADELGAANLRLAADKIAEIGGTVLLEPVSGAPAYPLKTAADVLAVIEKVGADNLKLLADFYHLAVNGDDVAAVIATTPPTSATSRSPTTRAAASPAPGTSRSATGWTPPGPAGTTATSAWSTRTPRPTRSPGSRAISAPEQRHPRPTDTHTDTRRTS